MLARIASRIAKHLFSIGVISGSDSSIYSFGIEIGFAMGINIFTTIFIGAVCGMLAESVLFLIVFALIRSYAGGYHASTHLRCYFLSVVVLIAALIVVKYALVSSVIAGISVLIILFLAPVQDKNKPLDTLEKQVYGKKARWITAFEFLFAIILRMCSYRTLSDTIFCVLIIVGISMIIGYLKNRKEMHQCFSLL